MIEDWLSLYMSFTSQVMGKRDRDLPYLYLSDFYERNRQFLNYPVSINPLATTHQLCHLGPYFLQKAYTSFSIIQIQHLHIFDIKGMFDNILEKNRSQLPTIQGDHQAISKKWQSFQSQQMYFRSLLRVAYKPGSQHNWENHPGIARYEKPKSWSETRQTSSHFFH